MKLIVKSIGLLLLLLVCVPLLSVEDKPLLRHRADLSPQRIAQGKRVLESNDPRHLKSGMVTQARLTERDLDLAINYAANQILDGVAGLSIASGRAWLSVTLNLPDNPVGRFLNVKVELRQTRTRPKIDHMTIGKLRIPAVVAEPIFQYAVMHFMPGADWKSLAAMIKRVEFRPKQTIVTYQWRDDLPGKLGAALWPDSDQNRLAFYQSKLVTLTRASRRQLKLTALMNPLFRLAAERSRHGDAIAENRALILVLASYVNSKDPAKLIPVASAWPRPVWRTVTLNGRSDLSKHYLVSAMLAAYAGTPLADAVGIYKEIEDARGGSGFSFNDIAADRAGRRMGELAVKTDAAARRIQRQLAIAKESDFMPATADLPEFMPEAEFRRRFGGLQGAKYRQMMIDIDRRIAELAINRY
ncbi:hypothetical protein [Methylomonas sp. MgM2]